MLHLLVSLAVINTTWQNHEISYVLGVHLLSQGLSFISYFTMESSVDSQDGEKTPRSHSKWRSFFGRNEPPSDSQPDQENNDRGDLPPKWSMGVLNDKLTYEVPGM